MTERGGEKIERGMKGERLKWKGEEGNGKGKEKGDNNNNTKLI